MRKLLEVFAFGSGMARMAPVERRVPAGTVLVIDDCSLSFYRETPAPWNGEGLPPVGCECEIDLGHHWGQATVIAHHDGGAVAAMHFDDLSYGYHHACAEYFRPLRTAEQLAAEAREAAIAEICEATNEHVTTRWAGVLYDLGYRKPHA